MHTTQLSSTTTKTERALPATALSIQAQRKVEFVLEAPQALAVCLAGTFNGWDPARTPMNQERHGVWRAAISLAPGRHEYRFVVDGQWMSDPKARASVRNQFGSENSVKMV